MNEEILRKLLGDNCLLNRKILPEHASERCRPDGEIVCARNDIESLS